MRVLLWRGVYHFESAGWDESIRAVASAVWDGEAVVHTAAGRGRTARGS